MICKKCPELVRSRNCVVRGYGDRNAKIMFVGICPGNHLLRGGADSTGIPFKGDRSGDAFEKLLYKMNLTRQDVYTTNLVKCRPAQSDIRYNRLPDSDEIANCLPYLLKEIHTVQPKVVIALGKMVFDELSGRDLGVPVEKAYHPSYIVRSNRYEDWFKDVREIIWKWTTYNGNLCLEDFL